MTRRDPVITGPLEGLELARTVVPITCNKRMALSTYFNLSFLI